MHMLRPVLAGAAVFALAAFGAPVASAAPAVAGVETLPPGPPVPVSGSEYGYVATHDLTVRADGLDLAGFVASIPVPAQYRAANLALGARFDAAVDSALTSPGGCVQVVVDPYSRAGNLFDYGFFPVAGPYCP